MKLSGVWAAAGIGLAAAALFAVQKPADRSAPSVPSVERGAYIVEHLSRCGQCHTPRDEKGSLIVTRWLSGAPIPVRSPFPGQPWAFAAPNIRGLVGYTDEEGVRLLTDGLTRDAKPPQPPMQQFGMKREDAEAVVAYLRSLK
ncbi:MAG: c-type cytochrome [Thermoanaerobaculia bacterium]